MVGISSFAMAEGLLVLGDAPGRTDTVTAIAGAAAALGGLLLVFLGVAVTSYAGYGGDVAEAVVRPYRTAGRILLVVFAMSLVSVGLSVTWFATGGGAGPLYEADLWFFTALLLSVLVCGGGTVYKVLLK
jgi:hypothetical protein